MASQEVGLATVIENIAKALDAEEYAMAEAILMPAIDQFPQLPQLWFHAGNLFFAKEQMALSMSCYERAMQLEPVGPGYANLGAAYRRMGDRDKALDALTSAAELGDDHPQVWSNVAACWVNEGNPDEGLKAVKRALELDPNFDRAAWNGALLHLERGDYAKGFDLYSRGLGKDRIVKKYARHYDDTEVPYYSKEKGTGGKLIVYGEQGIGDELMFASILNDASKDFDITFDCHPRLESLYRRNFYKLMDIYPTRKDEPVPWHVDHDYCISIGDLGALYRRNRADFTQAWKDHGPFYAPEPMETQAFRTFLEALADGRKIIGLTTRGGVMKTARLYRTIKIDDLAPLFNDKRYFFVSLDYENIDSTIMEINERHGEDTIASFRAVTHHFNYDHTASLVAATDAVVTVCQSVFHLAAAMGHPTLCLVPDKPAWRYGLHGKKHFWYPDNKVRLVRQKPDEHWSGPIGRLAARLEGML